MKTLAAVLVACRQPLELVELAIPELQPGQVLVELAYSGVCGTQLGEWQGTRGPDPFLPHCLGHEGSGRVLETGPGVTRCRAGDRVILSWIKGPGMNVPGTVYDWNGTPVSAGAVTTFARLSVVSENRLTVTPPELGLPQAALLGCAVPTGAGAVLNTAGLCAGQSLAVFGVGGVGLCAVLAASLGGAEPLVAVDVCSERLDAARKAGATHLVDARDGDAVTAIERLCNGGLDVAVEASGRPEVMRQALAAVRSQGGTAVVLGNAPQGEQLELDPRELNQGKRLLGSWGGDNVPERDFPRYCRLVTSGRLNLDLLLGRCYSLADINTALADLRDRRTLRPLIDMQLT